MGTIRLRDVNDDGNERARLRGKELVRIWGAWLGRVPWEISVTLTFDPARRFPVSRELADREAFWWLSHVAHVCRRPVGWAYALERGTSGLWHAHAVIVGAGLTNWKILAGAWNIRNGYAVVKPVRDHGAAIYATKQAKDGEVVLSDTITLRRFSELASSNIVVPLTPADAEASDER